MNEGARAARDPGVDARSLLANERTLLAWVRTALTFLAVGVGVAQFGDDVGAQRVLAGALLASAAACGVAGIARHRRTDTDIRSGRLPPPARRAGLLTAGAVVVVAVLSLGGLLLGA